MQVSSDLSIIDLDVPFTLSFSISATLNACINLGVMCFFTWQVLFVAAPVIIMSVRLQVSNPRFELGHKDISCVHTKSSAETFYCRGTT